MKYQVVFTEEQVFRVEVEAHSKAHASRLVKERFLRESAETADDVIAEEIFVIVRGVKRV